MRSIKRGQTEMIRCECGRPARWWAKSEMRWAPAKRTPMCDDLRDMLREENKRRKFVKIAEDS